MVRTTRGEDILAACGQLKSESQKMRRSERDALAAAHLAAQAAGADPATADRMRALEELERRQEETARASLYAAAKMGHVDATRHHRRVERRLDERLR